MVRDVNGTTTSHRKAEAFFIELTISTLAQTIMVEPEDLPLFYGRRHEPMGYGRVADMRCAR